MYTTNGDVTATWSILQLRPLKKETIHVTTFKSQITFWTDTVHLPTYATYRYDYRPGRITHRRQCSPHDVSLSEAKLAKQINPRSNLPQTGELPI